MSRLLLLLAATASAVAQSDSECGNATLPPKGGVKANVLIIGDSISMDVPYTPGGYGLNVQQILGAKGINVEHVGGWYGGGQCSNTVKGLLCTTPTKENNYLNFTGQYDVIHFNYGLHDLVNCSTGGECLEHVDLPTYGANLVEIYNRWRPRAKKALIWASTTPVPNVTTSMGRSYELAVAYNKQALTSLSAAAGKALIVDDLWSGVIAHCGAYYTSCDLQLPANVHFTPLGQQFLGEQVSGAILKALGM